MWFSVMIVIRKNTLAWVARASWTTRRLGATSRPSTNWGSHMPSTSSTYSRTLSALLWSTFSLAKGLLILIPWLGKCQAKMAEKTVYYSSPVIPCLLWIASMVTARGLNLTRCQSDPAMMGITSSRDWEPRGSQVQDRSRFGHWSCSG